ncbi:MAG: M48 family metalloprotease [Prolixibacteraceae bacterium]|nr:M48 family metalloprotease [Prolixibacteraceae bacterium]
MKKITFPVKALLLVISVLLIPSCAINPVTGKKQLMFVSESQEAAMGAEYDPQIVSSFGLYDNQELLNLITERGTEIGKISHRPNLQYHFRILDSPVVNAFAVPGGYVYVTRGILAQFNNEAELMGVLGHEIGHVTARHSAQQMTNQQLAQLGLVVGMVASKEFAKFADVASQGLQLLFLKFSRDHENQADRLGVEYASKIGYDTHKMADFFNVLKKMQLESSQGGIPTFLSTHPDPGDRYDRVNQLTDVWQDSLGISKWEVNQDNYLRMIDGLVYGEDPRQGYVEGNMFYHPELKFQYPIPGGWTLANSPLQVQMSPENGKALIVFTLAQQNNLDQAASETLKNLNLDVLNSTRNTVNGMPALGVLSEQASQNQQTGETSKLKVLSYFIDYNGQIFVFHGVSNEADFDSYFRLFESTMVSFNKLTDQRKINVEPKRVRIKQVQNSGTLADAFRAFGIPQADMNNLALLNDLELTDRVERGKLIKIIQ